MKASSTFPLSASRIVILVSYIFCTVMAVLLLVVAATLAVAWPQVIAETVAKGLEVKVHDLQPWVSLVLLGAGVILAVTAHVMKLLLSILKSVSLGDPFIPENTARLRWIGWLMVGLQGAGVLTGGAAMMIPDAVGRIDGFNLNFSGILAALLAFVLAEVFEQARRLRDDLEGTV